MTDQDSAGLKPLSDEEWTKYSEMAARLPLHFSDEIARLIATITAQEAERDALKAEVERLTAAMSPDMFWDYDNNEIPYANLSELAAERAQVHLGDAETKQEFRVQCAARFPDMVVKATMVGDEWVCELHALAALTPKEN